MNADKILRENNIKVTPQRKAILEALHRTESVQSAQELFQKVISRFPNINFSTVYRNLSMLVSKDIICQISTPERMLYEIKKKETHHHHVICKECGTSVAIDFCPMDSVDKKLSQKGFTPTEHRFEIYGYCSKCKGKKK